MKFKFGDKVKVTEGFYKGLVGIIDDVTIKTNGGYPWYEYYVDFGDFNITRLVKETEIQLIEVREINHNLLCKEDNESKN